MRGEGVRGKTSTKYEKDRFLDNKRDTRSGGAVVRLGKPGTNSKLSGMVYKIDNQKKCERNILGRELVRRLCCTRGIEGRGAEVGCRTDRSIDFFLGFIRPNILSESFTSRPGSRRYFRSMVEPAALRSLSGSSSISSWRSPASWTAATATCPANSDSH